MASIALASCASFFVYVRFFEESSLPGVGDRSYLLVSLIMAVMGSSVLLLYNDHGVGMALGLCATGVSLAIGFKALYDLFAKLVGVPDL
jgi:hypothetical protein